jgi:hypothetical protein
MLNDAKKDKKTNVKNTIRLKFLFLKYFIINYLFNTDLIDELLHLHPIHKT